MPPTAAASPNAPAAECVPAAFLVTVAGVEEAVCDEAEREVLLAVDEGLPVMETVETCTTVRVVVEVSAAARRAAGRMARSVEKRMVGIVGFEVWV